MENTRQKSMNRVIGFLIKVAIAGIFSVVSLSVLCLFYNYNGLRIKSESGATDYHWQPNIYISNMKEGFACIKTDANGYNNLSVPENINILLMGSSHMEALQVAQNENTSSLLNEMIPKMNTYNIGISGHTIYRCVDNMESAIGKFASSDYIIIETNSIKLDINEMDRVISENAIKESASSDSNIVRLFQKIPVFKPLYNQIVTWVSQDETQINKIDEIEKSEDYYSVLNSFLSIVEKTAQRYGVQTIIFYDPPQEFSEDGSLDYFHTRGDIALFREACAANNIIFVDMTPDFEAMYEEEHILAHGFANTAVGTGHLNKYGHRVIAERLAKVIGGGN